MADEGSKLRIITVGRLHPRKGQDRILDALGNLPSDLKETVEYILVGPETNPRYTRRLREKSNRVGLPVQFLGDLQPSELRKVYAGADVFALTSTYQKGSVEGFGFVYLEAASHGLPAIAHRIGGVEDAVVHDETGLLVAHDKPKELGEAMERMLRDAELRARMGQSAQVRAAKFNWEQPALDLYG